MNKRRILIGLLLTFAMLIGFFAITRPPAWRGLLYNGMFDACRDDSLIRTRIWLFLGASPDGASDYTVSVRYVGSEFMSHVHLAVSHPNCRVLRLLLSKGASPDLKLGDLTTPLALAIGDHRVEATKMLLEAGANPRYTDRWTALDQAKSLKYDDLIPIIQPYLKQR